MRRITVFTSLFFSGCVFAAVSPCTSLASGPQSGTEIQPGTDSYPLASINNINFSIPLSTYSQFITAALTGNPLPNGGGVTEFSVPACISLSGATNDFTPVPTLDNVPIQFGVYGTGWSGNPQYAQLGNTSDGAYTVGVKFTKYCPCGINNYNAGSNTCQTSLNIGAPYILLNVPIGNGIVYNHNPVASSNAIGYCVAGGPSTGGLFYSIFSAPGRIPAVGTYTGTVTIGIGGT